MSNKLLNIDNALDDNNQWWQRAALMLGWNTWDLGIKDKDIEAVKEEIKEEKKEVNKIKKEKKKQAKEELRKLENKAKEQENKNKNDGGCIAISRSGSRCKNEALPGKDYCTIHDKVEQRKDGTKVRCSKIKSDKTRCKMKTSNKSGLCYYHD